MKQITSIICTTILCINIIQAQSFNQSLNKDSLLRNILMDLPEEKKDQLLKEYNAGSEQTKEFLLFVFSMPKSSKKDLIRNIDSNYDKINYLKTEYAKLVPVNYTVLIEFNPEQKLVNTKENIDLRITRSENKQTEVFQDWNLEYNSDKLNQMLKMINWSTKTLDVIKKLLADAHCVSIENGEIVTIGFARSKLGKYSYKLFDNNLTSDQIKQYNNGCNDIFYKENIVLEYGGGAIGSQSFPD